MWIYRYHIYRLALFRPLPCTHLGNSIYEHTLAWPTYLRTEDIIPSHYTVILPRSFRSLTLVSRPANRPVDPDYPHLRPARRPPQLLKPPLQPPFRRSPADPSIHFEHRQHRFEVTWAFVQRPFLANFLARIPSSAIVWWGSTGLHQRCLPYLVVQLWVCGRMIYPHRLPHL